MAKDQSQIMQEAVLLRNKIAEIKQRILTSKSLDFINRMIAVECEVRSALFALKTVDESQLPFINVKENIQCTESERSSWVQHFEEFNRDIEKFGCKHTRAFKDIQECKKILAELEAELLQKEPPSAFTGVFAQPGCSSEITANPNSKDLLTLFREYAAYQQEVALFMNTPLLPTVLEIKNRGATPDGNALCFLQQVQFN